MALNRVPWVSMVLTVGIVVAVAVFAAPDTGPMPEPSTRAVVRREAGAARRKARTETEVLRLLQLYDSIVGAHGTALPRVVVDRRMDAGIRDSLMTMVQLAVRARSDARAHSAAIVVLRDDAVSLRGVHFYSGAPIEYDYVMPAASEGPCLALVRVRPRMSEAARREQYAGVLRDSLVRQRAARTLMGPCAFYEAFGAPGDSVREWLEAGAWRYATLSDWRTPIPRWYLEGWAEGNWLRYYTSPAMVSCGAGDVAACERQVLSAERGRFFQRLTIRPRTMDAAVFMALSPFVADDALGPRAFTFMAALAHDLGDERFRAFWTSPRGVTQAFRDATGQELGAWTHEWAVRMYGPQPRGPHVSASAALASLLVAGAAIGAALAAVRRRQVR